MINPAELDLLRKALAALEKGFDDLPDFTPEFDVEAADRVLQTVAERMQDNYPYYHPLYAGQMLKPPHAIARIAYAMSLWVNPNNHALDGGRASSAMEKECIVELGKMFGWDSPLGHLTGGGTMANLEALWVARQEDAGKRVIASEMAHYTHGRICQMLGVPFDTVPVDSSGRLSLDSLRQELSKGDVGTVIATLGTTGLGAVDPLHDILELTREGVGTRVHADTAYGGFFGLSAELSSESRHAYDALCDADSIVVDPHKHGLQPYGCGCVLFKDADVGRFYKHDSPYTYFSSAELHLGEISFECSRPGAAAVALWATQQLYPPVKGGQFAAWLDDSILAARDFHRRLKVSEGFEPILEPEIDIVAYAVIAGSTSEASHKARAVFDAAAREDLHLALIELPAEFVQAVVPDMKVDAETVTCLRSVLMKAEHADWVDRIMAILERSLASIK